MIFQTIWDCPIILFWSPTLISQDNLRCGSTCFLEVLKLCCFLSAECIWMYFNNWNFFKRGSYSWYRKSIHCFTCQALHESVTERWFRVSRFCSSWILQSSNIVCQWKKALNLTCFKNILLVSKPHPEHFIQSYWLLKVNSWCLHTTMYISWLYLEQNKTLNFSKFSSTPHISPSVSVNISVFWPLTLNHSWENTRTSKRRNSLFFFLLSSLLPQPLHSILPSVVNFASKTQILVIHFCYLFNYLSWSKPRSCDLDNIFSMGSLWYLLKSCSLAATVILGVLESLHYRGPTSGSGSLGSWSWELCLPFFHISHP